MGNPFRYFNNWRKSTYLSVIPVFGAGSGGDLLQVGPLAILSSLFDKNNKTDDKPFKRKWNRPNGQREIYVYQDERFDFVIYDWNPEDEYFDEQFLSSLAHQFSGYVIDPLNEKDHAWTNL